MQDNVRLLLGFLGGFGVLAVAGAYLAYRTLGFARRISAENVVLRSTVGELAEKLARGADRADILNAVERLVVTAEGRIGAKLDGVEQRLRNSERRLEGAEHRVAQAGEVREEIRKLRADALSTQGLVTRIGARNDAIEMRLSVATSSLEKLQLSTKSDVLEAVEDIRRGGREAQRRLDSLTLQLQAVARDADTCGSQISDLTAAHDQVAKLAKTLATDRGTDRSAISQLQREISVLTEVYASAQDRAGFAAEQLAGAVSRIHRLNDLQNETERRLTDVANNSASALSILEGRQQTLGADVAHAQQTISQSLVRIDQLHEGQNAIQAEASRAAAISTELAARQDGLAQTVGKMRGDLSATTAAVDEGASRLAIFSKQAEDTAHGLARVVEAANQQAAALSILEGRQQTLGADVAHAQQTISQSLVRIDQLHEGQNAIQAEASRAAAISTELAARQDGLAQTVGKMRGDLSATTAAVDEGASRLAIFSKQAEDTAHGLARVAEAANQQAAALSILEGRQQTLGADVAHAQQTLSQSLVRIDQLHEGQNAIQAEASRAAAISTELAARQDGLAQTVEKMRGDLSATTAAVDEGASRLAIFSKQAEDTAHGLARVVETVGEMRGELSATTAAVDEGASRLAIFSKQAEDTAHGLARVAEAANQQAAAMRDDVAAASNAHARLVDDVKALADRSEDTADLVKRAVIRQDEIASSLSDTDDRLAVVSARTDTLGDAINALSALTTALRDDQSAADSLLGGRLELVAADLVSAQAVFAERTADVAERLNALDTKVEKDASGERIGAIEADIAQVVRLVDDAEIAFADEFGRMTSAISNLSGDVELVNRNVALVTQLVNESEMATVAELTQLSAAMLQLKETPTAGKGRSSRSGDAADSMGPLRSRLAKAAEQLESAVRDTERALSELGATEGGARPKPRATKGAAKTRGAKSKKTGRSSSR